MHKTSKTCQSILRSREGLLSPYLLIGLVNCMLVQLENHRLLYIDNISSSLSPHCVPRVLVHSAGQSSGL